MNNENKETALEKVLLDNDLRSLNPQERVTYYKKVCESVGLNYLTNPFQYIVLNGKLTLYATKSATDQLRSIKDISIEISSRERDADLYTVTAKAHDLEGRTDESLAAVCITNLKGDQLANALMKAETKAKRRVTLSICSLGMLDETEVETIKGVQFVDLTDVHVSESGVGSPRPSSIASPKTTVSMDKPPLVTLPDSELEIMAKRKDALNYVPIMGELEGVRLGDLPVATLTKYREKVELGMKTAKKDVPPNIKLVLDAISCIEAV